MPTERLYTGVGRLHEIARQLREDRSNPPETPQETVRTILEWFGQRRRGSYVVTEIRRALAEVALATEPDFESVYIDALVQFVALDINLDGDSINLTEEDLPPNQDNESDTAEPVLVFGAVADPTFRVRQLESANTPPICVNENASLSEAATLMMMHNFSQLPVMQNERQVKGVVSWQSIGKRYALNRSYENVHDCMDTNFVVVTAASSLFSAISSIIEHGYVLVRQENQTISGIVTTSDLSLQFRLLAEPFLLIGEIENYIRRLINGKFTIEQLHSVRNPDDDRDITSVSNLTFGEYVRLLENPQHWGDLSLSINRSAFTQRLDNVKNVRNEVMHFKPDPIEPEKIEMLRTFVGFMRELVNN